MLTKIKGLFNRTNKGTYLALLFMIVFIFSGDVAFAEDKFDAVTSMNVLIAILSVIVGFFSSAIGFLIGADFTSGALFGSGFKYILKDLWILVSNVVYFIFAFILVWIAFMNIIGKEGAEYELKQSLPKFIVGVLIVPFSWFIVNFIISISAILTVSVIGLATDTISSTTDSKTLSKKVCTNMKINVSTITAKKKIDGAAKSGTKITVSEEEAEAYQGSIFNCKGKTSIEDILKDKNSVGGLMATYTYGIMKLDATDTFFKGDIIKGASNIVDIFLKLGFDAIFLVVYGILLIAIVLVLFIRGVYLWLFMIFSPIFGLLYFLGDKGGEKLKEFDFNNFISLAMVPVYVAAALSFGMMFTFIAYDSMQGGKTVMMDDLNNGILTSGPTKLEIEGTFGGLGKSKGVPDELFNKVKGLTGKTFISIIAIVILWMTVMAALSASKITEAAIKPIADFGNSIGTLMKNAPQYIPIAPNGQSIASMGQGASQYVNTKYGSAAISGKAGDFSTSLGGSKTVAELDKMQKEIANNKSLVNSKAKISDQVKKAYNAGGKTYEEMSVLEREKAIRVHLEQILGVDTKDLGGKISKWAKNKDISLVSNEMKKDITSYVTTNYGKESLLTMTSDASGVASTVKSGKGDNKTEKLDNVKKVIDTDTDFGNYLKNNGVYIKQSKKTDGSLIDGAGEIIIEESDGKGKKYTIRLTATPKDANAFIGEDLTEAKELYEKLGEDNFKKTLNKIGFDSASVDNLTKSASGGSNKSGNLTFKINGFDRMNNSDGLSDSDLDSIGIQLNRGISGQINKAEFINGLNAGGYSSDIIDDSTVDKLWYKIDPAKKKI